MGLRERVVSGEYLRSQIAHLRAERLRDYAPWRDVPADRDDRTSPWANRQRQSPEDRLVAHLSGHPDPAACWIWTGGTTNQGLGLLRIKKSSGEWGSIVVHRLAWQLWRDVLPAGVIVRQICGDRLCCNPDHLELVSRRRESDQVELGEWFDEQIKRLRGST